ncbi:MBL fold metallo-hydrolase [Pseudomaricurvus alkylphenolicus]|uniref:MBL fold metallo-hydrolase n=1 Tax=Pseudomaricurvus alkylphenolicus TaxID=1306991 RepID=UPI001420FCFF|nr:MBL fold metallo-hydrolase [Pseudomaricurvus alkylphenolicus]NIB45184.1 MBL fold metallo-hydrolase [Pseudomaricurvus alkylphenolicus]
MNNPEVHSFFDTHTYTITHVVADPQSKACAVVDPVLNYEPNSGRTATRSIDDIIDFIVENGFTLEWILETHIHADHLSSAPYLKEQLGGKIAIGNNVRQVQETFSDAFNVKVDFARDGSDFDQLFTDGDNFRVGTIMAQAVHTPGHTPACMTYMIGDVCFVGDTLFMPDFGSARCDFPGGDADTLYDSIQKIFSLPDETRLFMCHDYKAPGREKYQWETTVGEQKRSNIHVGGGISKEEFVAMRSARDAQLKLPQLILPSVQVNMRAGQLPKPESNGKRYLKIPVDVF